MDKFFEVKVSYFKSLDTGKIKKTTGLYIFAAKTCAEAEAAVVQTLTPVLGELAIIHIKEADFAEVMNDDCASNRWYKVKTSIVAANEAGAMKTSTVYTLVSAATLESAIAHYKAEVSIMADYEIVMVAETNIIAVHGC